MFSEMMRMRPACARRPDAAMASDLMKSITGFRRPLSALVGGELDEAQTVRVELRRGLEVHLVLGHLHHLVLEGHGVAGRTHLVLLMVARERGRIGKALELSGIVARQLQRRE